MNVLLTGAAGFIGFHLARRLLSRGDLVTGVDNLNAYYDVALKGARLERLRALPGFRFERLDISDRAAMERLFEGSAYDVVVEGSAYDVVVNLAAQAGVRYSLENPHAYVQSNVMGFLHILEGVRASPPRHLVYASTSSVYGANTRLPFDERQNADHPMSIYSATKKANELMAHSYAHLFGIPCTGLRFFTVYGPWGRPPYTVPGAVPTWRSSSSRAASSRGSRFRSSTRAGWSGTSPMSTTSWRASCG
jgi:UDP-glucuronate 4-epimerase